MRSLPVTGLNRFFLLGTRSVQKKSSEANFPRRPWASFSVRRHKTARDALSFSAAGNRALVFVIALRDYITRETFLQLCGICLRPEDSERSSEF